MLSRTSANPLHPVCWKFSPNSISLQLLLLTKKVNISYLFCDDSILQTVPLTIYTPSYWLSIYDIRWKTLESCSKQAICSEYYWYPREKILNKQLAGKNLMCDWYRAVLIWHGQKVSIHQHTSNPKFLVSICWNHADAYNPIVSFKIAYTFVLRCVAAKSWYLMTCFLNIWKMRYNDTIAKKSFLVVSFLLSLFCVLWNSTN